MDTEKAYEALLALAPGYAPVLSTSMTISLWVTFTPRLTAAQAKLFRNMRWREASFTTISSTYVLLAQVYEHAGDVNRARQTYPQALTVDPNFYSAQTNLARLYADHGRLSTKLCNWLRKPKRRSQTTRTSMNAQGWISL